MSWWPPVTPWWPPAPTPNHSVDTWFLVTSWWPLVSWWWPPDPNPQREHAAACHILVATGHVLVATSFFYPHLKPQSTRSQQSRFSGHQTPGPTFNPQRHTVVTSWWPPSPSTPRPTYRADTGPLVASRWPPTSALNPHGGHLAAGHILVATNPWSQSQPTVARSHGQLSGGHQTRPAIFWWPPDAAGHLLVATRPDFSGRLPPAPTHNPSSRPWVPPR